MKILTLLILALLLPLFAQAAPLQLAQSEKRISLDIPAGELTDALKALAKQTGSDLVYRPEQVEGLKTAGIKGEYTAKDAITQLLKGTALRLSTNTAGAMLIAEPKPIASVTRDAEADRHEGLTLAQADQAIESQSSKGIAGIPEVVVTGTNIRGVAPRSSPVEVYTAEDIAATGATTTEQFIGKLPQNLGTYSQYAAGATVADNNDSVTSVDLRGLGVGTTLALLNGRRVAPSNSGQSVDVSLIPASAIKRVEVLTDGASAIYGSDAIGGVINFVMRNDFEGAETRVSYGGVTNGELRQRDFDQTFGRGWGSGHGLVTYNYHSASALKKKDRWFTAPSGPGNLTPDDTRHNLFVSLSQDIGERIAIGFQGGGSIRDIENEYTYSPATSPNRLLNIYESETKQYFGSFALDYRISDAFSAQLVTAYSNTAIDGELWRYLVNQASVPSFRTDFGADSSSYEVMAKLDGALFALPGGHVRFSMGGGVVGEEYTGFSPLTANQSTGTLARRSPFMFGEMLLPLAHRLELSVAARYTDYQDASRPRLNRDFGNSTDPKIGLFWSPIESLSLRATYGTSFRTTALTQTDPSAAINYLDGSDIAGLPATVFAVIGYAVPDLLPETAETYTFGFNYRSDALPGFQLSSTYYTIDYADRIGLAPFGGMNPFERPDLLPDVIYRAPSAAFIEEQLRVSSTVLNDTGIDLSNPAAAAAILFARPDLWIYDVRFRNLATSKQDGFDVSAHQSIALPWGELGIAANVTHILKYVQRGSPNAALLTAVDIPGAPADWRGRASVSLSKEKFRGSLSVNYIDTYLNPYPAVPQRVESWTTADLSLSYDFGAASRGPRLNLSVQNLFDEDPPLMQSASGGTLRTPIGFDPANANPLGRLAVIGLVQKW